ncbi:MAG: formyltetrahydrofolate deformylase [Proteobacteria bacterium]|nr:formyltetrahydrofolate deformylase [Pseudomonadota bacterium]
MPTLSAASHIDHRKLVLRVTCAGGRGIVAAVTGFLAARDCYINELAQFDDRDSNALFMRVAFEIENDGSTKEKIISEFPSVAEKFDMAWTIHSAATPTRTLIMVSKFDHCLADLLYRHQKGELNVDITAVVSNHRDLHPMVERLGIRFVHLPMTKETKLQQEQALREIMSETRTELVVLARYMQILTDKLCRELEGRAINIHHSFLPGFKGAKPYHQAFERGVKLIGATAHYVTANLDEGPIIEQAVQSVDHTYSPEMLTSVGRDTETIALARAVKLHTEHRVFLDGNKTVIFK